MPPTRNEVSPEKLFESLTQTNAHANPRQPSAGFTQICDQLTRRHDTDFGLRLKHEEGTVTSWFKLDQLVDLSRPDGYYFVGVHLELTSLKAAINVSYAATSQELQSAACATKRKQTSPQITAPLSLTRLVMDTIKQAETVDAAGLPKVWTPEPAIGLDAFTRRTKQHS